MRPRLAAASGLLAVLVAAGIAVSSCGEVGPGPAPGPSDTGATARRTWAAFYRPPTDRVPPHLATNPGTPWGDWVGSRACQECHADLYARWRDSFHSRTLYDAVPQTVFGDFTGTKALDDARYAFTVRPLRSGERFFLRVERNAASAQRDDTYGAGLPPDPTGVYEVLHAFGNRRHQPYVARAKDGRPWVLPAMWDDAEKAWAYCGWRPYTTNCANCHVTGIRSTDVPGDPRDALGSTFPTRWNPPAAHEGWAEGAVGCETCHGPGRPHVEAVRAMGVEAYRAHLAAGGAPTIYDPAKDTRERRIQQCDQCHSFLTESPVTWHPGPRGYARDPKVWRIRPGMQGALLGDEGQFYADGTDMSPCTVGWALRDSAMGRAQVECRDCHDPHGNAHWAELTLPVEDNGLCLRCHASDAGGRFADEAAVLRHTRHARGSPGSICAECHMPRTKRFSDGVHVMSAHLPGHEFSVPTGLESRAGGPPSACVLCHVDRDDAWTRRALHAWRSGTTPPR